MGVLRNYLTVHCSKSEQAKFIPEIADIPAFRSVLPHTTTYSGAPVSVWFFTQLSTEECKTILYTVNNGTAAAFAFWHQQYEGDAGLPIFVHYELSRKTYSSKPAATAVRHAICTNTPYLHVGGQNISSLGAYMAVVLDKAAYFTLELLSLIPKEGAFHEESGIWYTFAFDTLTLTGKPWRQFIQEGLPVLQSACPGQFKLLWRDSFSPKMHVFGEFPQLPVMAAMKTVHDTQKYISRIRECPHTAIVEVQKILATVT